MSENSTSEFGAFLAGFVIGGLVGAATAIILAPQSGQETRAQIVAKSNELVHAGEEQYQQYRDAAGNYTSQMVESTRQQVEAATGRVQEQARIILDRGNETPSSENGGNTEESTEPTDSDEASA